MAFTFKHGDRPLDGYTIQRGVGRGGFGEVYYALSDGGKEVALKYLRDNPGIELRGVAQCLNLKSPHLVSIFDVKQNPAGDDFIVMEYVAGPSLRDLLIEEPEGLGLQKALYFLREIGQGLSYLHERGIVHRDLKPGNILCDEGRVKIGDYGLSKFITLSRHSAQTASVGTVHYMAPEVGSGSYSRGVDIYALGVILYEMLLGKVPYDGASMGEVVVKHLTAQPEVDALPTPFPSVIRKALAKDPKERFATVSEMLQAVFCEPNLEQSLSGFEPMSLTHAAARHHVKMPVAAGVPSAAVSSEATGLTPFSRGSGPQGEGDTSDATGSSDRSMARRRRLMVGLLIAGGVMLAFAPVSTVMNAIDDRVRGVDIAITCVFGALAIQAFVFSGILYSRLSPKRDRFDLPLQHAFDISRRADFEDMTTRFLGLLGYRLADHQGLLWRFKRGNKSGEWANDIRKYKTTLALALFETSNGYRVNCSVDVDAGWSCWVTQKEMRFLAGELRALQDMLQNEPASKDRRPAPGGIVSEPAFAAAGENSC